MAIRNCLVFVNPRGGVRRGLQVLEQVRPIFRRAHVELDVRINDGPGLATQLARAINLDACDAICVIGGDGTVHEVANGLMQREEAVSIPLGLIPAGTGNTLHHQIECLDPVAAAQCVLGGKTCALDVVEVTTEDEIMYCVNIVGWGAVTDINLTAERLRILGHHRYGVAALWQILWPAHRRATLVLDGEEIEDEFGFVMACNTKSTGAGMLLAPDAEIDDGQLDVVVFRSRRRIEMLKLFRRVFDGTHLGLSGVQFRQVRSLGIASESNDLLNLDGEIKGSTPFTAKVLPAALRLFVHPTLSKSARNGPGMG